MSEQFAVSISIVPLVTAALVTPGYVILFLISRFTTGRPAFPASLAVSSVYYVVVWAFLRWGSVIDVAERIRSLSIDWSAVLIVAVLPLSIGVIVGIGIQSEWLYRILRRFGLEPVHGIPSAWDWKFMRARSQWITVYLKDGEEENDKKIVALYDADCFVSTDPKERDLYLSNVHQWSDGETGEKKLVQDERIEGLLLKAESIERIEFHEDRTGSDSS